MTSVVLVDDHVLLRKGLANLIESFGTYTVLFQADNGKDLCEKFKTSSLPQLILLDINMPEMDGYETSLWIKNNHPSVKILALSMNDNESAIIRMFKAGAKGYILKDCEPAELKFALDCIIAKGFYYSEMVADKLVHNISGPDENQEQFRNITNYSEREITFIKLACTELTYREIAAKMFVSPRTVDDYRDELFRKFDVKTRVGLAMYAIRNGIVNL